MTTTTTTTVDRERERIGAALDLHLSRQRAARILDEHRTQRAAERAARADATRTLDSMNTAQRAAARMPNLELLAAKRRDEYERALSYPMTAGEVLTAVRNAVRAAGLSWETDESAHEVIGILQLQVMRRHGTAPLRCKVGAGWLRERAQRIYDRECERRERATGLRASAELHARWAGQDADSARDDSGPDAVWYAAANMPAPSDERPLSAAAVAERLQLSGKQTGALVIALESAQRLTVAMTAAERKAAADARVILRKRYPDAETLRYALRPARAMLAAVDSCKRTAAGYRPGRNTGPDSERPVRERPAPILPDLGCFPLRVRIARGPVWRPVRIGSDPRMPAHGGPGCAGPRPHAAARVCPSCAAEGNREHCSHVGTLVSAAEPKRTLNGWAAIRRNESRRRLV